MWQVTGGNSDVVNDYTFKFSVNCKVYVTPISLETVIVPVKRHFDHILSFSANGLDGANISFQPNHNYMFLHGVKYQRLTESKAKMVSANRKYDKLSAIAIAKNEFNFKNKAKVKNIKEAI